MGDEPEFSQDGVLNFLVESGGRAANTELLHRFRGALGEPSARELFKGFVNAVGLVKQEDGAKYVVLKKKYKQHLVVRKQTAGVDGPRTAEADDRGGGGDERADGTLLPSELPPDVGSHSEQSAGAAAPAKQQVVAPSKAGEMTRIIALPSCASVDEERGGGGGAAGDASSGDGGGGGGEASSATTMPPPPVAISITAPSPAVDATRRGGPFAEGDLAAKAAAAARRAPADASSQAVSSQGHAAASAEEDEGTTTPGSRSEAAACTEAEGSGSQDVGEAGRGDSGEEGCRGESGPGGPDSSSQEVSSGATASAAAAAAGADAGGGVGRGSFKTTSKKNLAQGLRVPGSPQAKRHNSSSSSSSPKSPFIAPNFGGGGDSDTESVGSARTSEDDAAGGGGSSFGAPLALEPVEHEWIVSAARGDWSNLHGLLLGEPSLALRRDPLTGYTALHWAAKHGKADMVPVLVAAAESSAGTADDVNVRSHGGYTALHLAAMHGHTDVAKMLVGAYEANVNARDYSGRKPWHYLGQDASWEIRELLEAPAGDGAERPAATEAARRKLPRPYLGSLRIPAGHGGGAGSDDEADGGGGGGGGGGNFLRDMQLMRRQSFAKLLKAPMNKKRHKTQIIHSSSSVRETRAKEEGDLPVGKVAL
ncbi:uncharacterized protein LOC116943460 [Petromyzon marinus]|uniref:uncharacterized protein LOC116943460 n=1 Tax=Petromyzon marinus TaxID=7757 RepID=UPI003F6EC742